MKGVDMAKGKVSKAQKAAIRDARNLISEIERKDANEAETRQRVERVFERVMGYDALRFLSRERAVHGTGDTEHVDFAIQVDAAADALPVMMVELKRVGLDLATRHLKQASRYAIDAGCAWVLLTNGRQWQLYHVEFGQPPVTKLVEKWDLQQDPVEDLDRKFGLISYRNVKRGALEALWETTQVLAPESLLKAILSRESTNALRRVLKRESGVRVKADQIVSGLRKMLNENAAAILEDVEVRLPEVPKRRARGRVSAPGRPSLLKEMVQAGLLEPGARLSAEYAGSHYDAEVGADGTVMFGGQSYKNPSAAGGAVTAKRGVSNPNGLTFWHVSRPDGSTIPLSALRTELRRLRPWGHKAPQRQGDEDPEP